LTSKYENAKGFGNNGRAKWTKSEPLAEVWCVYTLYNTARHLEYW